AAPTLGQLVARSLKLVPELPRLRLSSIDAAEIAADLMRCLGEEPRPMPYLHLSLQAGDYLILQRMKCRHLRADALRLAAEVRALVEKPGTARAEDFTEIAFDGEAAPGSLISGRAVSHDGRRARLESWEAA